MNAAEREALRAEHQSALDLLIAPVEDLVSRLLRAILRAATVEAFSLTAAAPNVDVSALSGVPNLWQSAVQDKVLPAISDVYQAGGLGVFVGGGLPGTRGQFKAVAERIATRLPEVLPIAGQNYLAQAANRLTNIGDVGWNLTRDALVKGMEQGLSVPDLQAEVRNAINVSDERARVIARTEVVAATNAGSIDTARLIAGEVALWKVWLATMDARTRETHAEADGQTVPLDGLFDVGGSAMDLPGDPAGPPEEVINCRCTITYTDEPPEGAEPLPVEEQVMEEPEVMKAKPIEGRVMSVEDLKGTWSDSAEGGFRRRPGEAGDPALRRIYEEQGFHGKPAVVSEDDLNRLVNEEGHVELFRGMTTAGDERLNFAEDFRSGDYFAGYGVYGNGTYAAYGDTLGQGALDVAKGYANAGNPGAQVIRMAVDPDAIKWVWSEDIERRWYEARQAIQAEKDALTAEVTPLRFKGEAADAERILALEADISAIADVQKGLDDVGRYATSQGYDAIRVPQTGSLMPHDTATGNWNNGYLVILNRTAVVVQDTNVIG